MSKFIVEFYETESGEQPARDFLISLNTKMRAKMTNVILALEENGNDLREPYSKPLGKQIFELRTSLGNDAARILYFFYYGRHIVLTNGFVKKSRKTPTEELERARRYRSDYLARKESENE
ncbi:MAG: type II toxin-antitoxin system RelE/ParE family toxin [Lachnospiraceae bacterium]|nr:type II toxin-antitoxin system RelE/ParE family toxin [Lachnospiraceae bacterium]